MPLAIIGGDAWAAAAACVPTGAGAAETVVALLDVITDEAIDAAAEGAAAAAATTAVEMVIIDIVGEAIETLSV